MTVNNDLQRIFAAACDRLYCVRMNCACGAGEFRKAVALSVVGENLLVSELGRNKKLEVARKLTRLSSLNADKHAVMRILIDLWEHEPSLDNELAVALEGSWVGEVLQSMIVHSVCLEAKKKAKNFYDSPSEAAKRRTDKQAASEIRLQARAEIKLQIDEAWHRMQGPAKESRLILNPASGAGLRAKPHE